MGHPPDQEVFCRYPLPHGKISQDIQGGHQTSLKTTISIGVIIKVGIIRLCMSFDGTLRYKVKDDLEALSNPIRYSSNKSNCVHRMRTAFPEKLGCCLNVFSKCFGFSTFNTNNFFCQTLMSQQSQLPVKSHSPYSVSKVSIPIVLLSPDHWYVGL